jgi:MFS family permease
MRLTARRLPIGMIIFGLNIAATFLCGIGFMLGQFDPASRKRNYIAWADEVTYSFRHLRFDRYLLTGVVIILLISFIPQRIALWAKDFGFASMYVSGAPVAFLAISVVFMIFDRNPSLSSFILILLGSLIFLASSLIPFFSNDGRNQAIRVYDRFGVAAPTIFAAAIGLYALVLFSWIGLFLSVHNWISISGADGSQREDLGFYLSAFGYETAKAIPVIDVSDTFQWKAPYSHSGIPAGMLILVFRIAVLTPVVGFYGAYWNHVRERRKARSRHEAISRGPLAPPSSESDADGADAT